MPVATTTPVVERIALVLLGRVQLLVAGWSEVFYVSDVFRPTVRNNQEAKDRQVIIKQIDDSRVPELDCPGNPPAEARIVTFGIHLRINPSEDDETAEDDFGNSFTSVLRTAVCSPGATWHTMDGLAVDSSFGTYSPLSEDGSIDGVGVSLSVTYRVSELNPFEPRG